MITNSIQVAENEVNQYSYEKDNGIIGWMDCGGSNLVKINEQIPGIVKIIATTRGPYYPGAGAVEKSRRFNVPLAIFDFSEYERRLYVSRGDYFKALNPKLHSKISSRLSPDKIIKVREDACKKFMEKIYEEMDKHGIPHDLPMFAAGGMALLSKEFIETFHIFNIHPGDLTRHGLEGIMRSGRIITGDGWIPPAKAISAGDENLYSSMHIMTYEMDAGPVLMRGYPLPIDYNYLLSRVDIKDKRQLEQVGSTAQETLKHIGDHVIAGATFQDIFDGKWGIHESGVLAYKYQGSWYLAPNGIKAEDHAANNPGSVFRRDEIFIDNKLFEFDLEVERIGKAAKQQGGR